MKKKTSKFAEPGVMEADGNLEDDYDVDEIPQMNAADCGNDPNKPTKSRKDTGNYEYEESTEEEEEKADLFSLGAMKKKKDGSSD